MSNIIITHCPLNIEKDQVLAMAHDDPELINEIKKISKEKESQHVETFMQYQNIIATEEGYYFAFWDYQLEHAEEIKDDTGDEG